MKLRLTKTSCALTAIVTAAAVLRLLHLGRESLWFDESISVAIARQNWTELGRVVSQSEANMALYYGLLHIWMRLGDSEFAVRSLSVVCGVLTVPFLYALGKRMFDAKVGLISAGLLAANAFHIRYSQEARGYSLVALLVTLSSFFFVRAMERQSRKDWLWYVLAGTLAVHAHFFGALVLAAQWVSVISFPRRDVQWKRLVVSIGVISVLLLPLALFVLTRDAGQLAWVSRIGFYDVYALLLSLAGGGRLLILAYSAFLVVALLAFATGGRSRAPLDTWHYGVLLSWFLVPISFTFLISLFKPILVDRFLIICLPPFVLLSAVGVSKLSPRWVLAGSLAVLLALSLRRVPWYRSQLATEDWRSATSYVVTHASPKDGILFYTSYGRWGFDYYSRRQRPTTPNYQVVFPEVLNFEGDVKPDPDDSLLASLPKHYDQVWLFVRFNDLDPRLLKRDQSIEAMLAREYAAETEQKFQGVRVLQYRSSENAQR